jgi:hypothetical protein
MYVARVSYMLNGDNSIKLCAVDTYSYCIHLITLLAQVSILTF